MTTMREWLMARGWTERHLGREGYEGVHVERVDGEARLVGRMSLSESRALGLRTADLVGLRLRDETGVEASIEAPRRPLDVASVMGHAVQDAWGALCAMEIV